MQEYFRAVTAVNRAKWEYPGSWNMQFYITTTGTSSRWESTHATQVGHGYDGNIIIRLPDQLRQALLEAGYARHYKINIYQKQHVSHNPDVVELEIKK